MAGLKAPVDEGVTYGSGSGSGNAYDRESFRTMANDLYERADRIVFNNTIVGAIFCAPAGVTMLIINPVAAFVAIVVLALVGGFIGKQIGAYRAFLLRFQAHAALCQIVIEERLERLSKR